jgi:PAS domain S-box-containing protein
MNNKGKSGNQKKENAKQDPLMELRRKAELKLKSDEGRLRDLSAADMKNLVHELGTHQIELEMQNEELRRARAELEASHAKYVDLYDFSPVGYFLFDKSGLIKEVNVTGANMLGIEKRLLQTKPFQSFVDPDHRAVFRDHLSEVFRSLTGSGCEVVLRRSDGGKIHARLQSLSFVTGEGDPGVCRTAISDITEQKHSEEEIRDLNEDLKRSLLEKEAVNKELEVFSYSVSHDLRAPLRSIEGFTAAILEDSGAALSAVSKDYFQRVLAASQRMSQLIDAMLNLARLTRGELRERTVDLSGLTEVTVSELQKKDPARRASFVIAKGVKAKGDMDMLRMVIENLLENAWKFTGKHASATIEFGVMEMRNADFGVRNDNRPSPSPSPLREEGGVREQSQTVYFVRDDGAGFMMHYAEKLFKPFQRLHTPAEFPGIGIGLATVKRIIDRHGGRIWAEGAPEQGATFYFTLD